MAVENLV